ncbi:glycosyltransferase [Rhodoplanes azumiensis]|uniref:Glycosyltransferase n=1 Tax=Rhodoplanes azumiensis TaxID=1897628 RepID=A0ABW5ARF9_9BRAD
MLSVVIPTRDCERALVRTLAVLVGAAVAGAVREVIVADAGSQDETTKVAEIAGCTTLVSSAPLAARLRAAAAAARASWLMFLRPGAMPDPAWAEEAIRVVEDLERHGRLDMGAVFRTEPAGASPSLGGQAMALLREAVRRQPSPDQGLLIGRRFYDTLGGHPDGDAPEAALLGRIGRRRLIRLRSGITGAELPG